MKKQISFAEMIIFEKVLTAKAGENHVGLIPRTRTLKALKAQTATIKAID